MDQRDRAIAAAARRMSRQIDRERRMHKWYAVAGFLVGAATVTFNLWIGG